MLNKSFVIETFGDRVAPDGSLVRDNFMTWFGCSHAVDSSGCPLVAYHGTTSDFDAFDLGMSFDGGIHFGDANAADQRLRYWLDGNDGSGLARVLPFFLAVDNPKALDIDPYDEEAWAEQIERAKLEGHDGIRYPNSVEGGESWVIFDPGQAKSALGNSGLFNRQCVDFTDLFQPVLRAASALAWLNGQNQIDSALNAFSK